MTRRGIFSGSRKSERRKGPGCQAPPFSRCSHRVIILHFVAALRILPICGRKCLNYVHVVLHGRKNLCIPALCLVLAFSCENGSMFETNKTDWRLFFCCCCISQPCRRDALTFQSERPGLNTLSMRGSSCRLSDAPSVGIETELKAESLDENEISLKSTNAT